MITRLLFAGALAAASLTGLNAQAQSRGPDSLGADWRQQQDEARAGVAERRLVPLSRVISELRGRNPGRPLDAGLEYQGDRAIYRVRWMSADGRRIDFLIDATTGAILSGQ
jgi:uncharacterized membrane protein YkoI